jgi:hypothetical protein
MFRKTICTVGLLVLLAFFLPSVLSRAAAQENATTKKSSTAQERPEPLDPNDPRLTFSFPIQKDGKPFSFKVNLDKTGIVSGVSVFRASDATMLQSLPACKRVGLSEPVTDDWGGYYISNLLDHADLNFDGFEDLELLDYAIPHLDKKIYCIYLWDTKAGRFSYSKELTDISVNLEAHPENKTLTVSEDWQGGASRNSTYRWNGGKLELIEQDSLLGTWGDQSNRKCGFTFTCSRLVNGEMVTTLEKPICTQDEFEKPPECPAASTPPAPKAPPAKPATEKRN